jgi:glutamine amidotransferase
MRIAVVNYGVGNLYSVKRSFERAGCTVKICSAPGELDGSDAIVLPGVGNFKTGAENIQRIRENLLDIIDSHIPVLGICLGMQLLFEESDESPGFGLGIFSGRVIRLPKNVRAPHMGWNNLNIIQPSKILDGIGGWDYFYFAHKYYALPADRSIVTAETEYGVKIPSAVAYRNIFGVQFHPEKSGKPGKRVIENFVEIAKR